jgi:adenylate kinase
MVVVLMLAPQAVGKTTICQLLEKYDVQTQEVSSLMTEKLIVSGRIQTRDELRYLSWRENQMLFSEVVTDYCRTNHNRPNVLVVHLQPRRVFDIYFTVPYKIFLKARLKSVITLIAPASQVYARIRQDIGRQRALTSIDLIQEEQQQTLLAGQYLATQLNIDAFAVGNFDGEHHLAVEAIMNILNRS